MKVLIAAAAILLAGCASKNKVGESYVQAHPELDPETKRRILAQEVVAGMTAEQVLASVGGPGHVQRMAGGTEHWEYQSFVLTFKDGVLVSWVHKKVLY